jgi:hypothetical protein
MIICPKCGAQTPAVIHNTQITCSYCGSSFSAEPTAEVDLPRSSNELGYTPDPPPDPAAVTSEKPDEESPVSPDVKAILAEEEALPQQVAQVIDTGRRVSRSIILVVAILLILCSVCIIFGNFQK